MKRISQMTLSALALSLSAAASATAAPVDTVNNLAAPLAQIDRFNPQAFQVSDIKKVMAKSLARELSSQGPRWQSTLASQSRLTVQDMQVSQQAQSLIGQASTQTRVLKGLPQCDSNLYQLRLASADMLSQWQEGEEPLIAFAPKGDDKTWIHVEAYDSDGQLHLLDAQQMPQRPVLVLELDQQQVRREGLAVMQDIFSSARQTQGAERLSRDMLQTNQVNIQSEAISTSVLKRIRLNNDQEPWILGKAEVYGIVTGVSPSRDEPVLDIVDMPYLDHDGTDYTPNQILIHWERYRWQAADVLLMEQDDNTNYKDLATTFLDIVTQVMRTIPDPNVQGYAIIPQLTNQLIKAMPDHWFSNDDDYVDVFYTLFEGQNYSGHMGASNNAKITLSPLTIEPR
ncbi:DUF3103 domain-containing protein [Pseudoalteromonas rubra]|uniref:DUF3103 domain-containing protein n=1 Tax=Pseudoalteromonas rubra TaxID=43658 RepID=A0A5S3WRU8_9GAMM|nr:DUF3103 family protein [Pseudoalteromonas rubra]TMP30002.1 DUF3103 domain-containing protein [Pseudoalteromonas rubra]TMP30582.1 DUF3103 domain-containing protein [Pseudoalteromonas rubra]